MLSSFCFWNTLFKRFLSLYLACSSVPPTELNAVGRHGHRGPSAGWRARDHRHSDEGRHQDLGPHWWQAGDGHQHRWKHLKQTLWPQCEFKSQEGEFCYRQMRSKSSLLDMRMVLWGCFSDVRKSSNGVEVPSSLQPDVQQCWKLYVLWS